MCSGIIFFTYILCLHGLVKNWCFIQANYHVKCPSEQLWNLRAQSICPSVEKYTCLLDSVKNTYKESCNGPRNEPPGEKTVVNSGNFDSKPCHPDLYQPFSFSSTAGSDCIFTKTICSEVGQVIKSVGSRKNDRECRCDYSRNFSFLSTKRKSLCSCDPTKEDCSCFIKPCGQEKILSPDYHCIKKEDFYGKFVCEEIDIAQGLPTDVSHSGIKGSDNSNSITVKTAEFQIVPIPLIVFTGILISDRKPKTYKYTNEISEESLEDYKDELYGIVIGLIKSKGILSTYKSQDRTMTTKERKKTEAKERKVVLGTLQTQRNMTNVLNEMKKNNFKMLKKMEV
ncbi:unnamed protein product [Mytilus edulis]|uniref:Uncharacterized protein n=1 Tax=Mytilus edulis TaxID=6550 RepID=A0A8S3PUH2_MYTED|nr:unnamed protein product [Mytilus edulis]